MPLRDIAGHRRIVELLLRSVERNTLPPSLIFSGPSGSGKRDTAVALAQAVNCLTPRDGDACGTCASCTRIARGVHPDVLIVEPADSGSIRIDPIRDAIDRASYRPFEGRRRVVIIDDADRLVPAAQNALLKTLEEPSAASVFVLVTARPDMLLVTVRSRCIRLVFAGGAAAVIDDDVRDTAHRVLAQVAGGRDAQRLEGARELLAGTGGGAGAASDRETVSRHLRSMAALLRDIEAIHAGADAATVTNSAVRPALERLTPAYGGERGVRAYAAIDAALAAIEANAGVKVVADWLVLQL